MEIPWTVGRSSSSSVSNNPLKSCRPPAARRGRGAVAAAAAAAAAARATRATQGTADPNTPSPTPWGGRRRRRAGQSRGRWHCCWGSGPWMWVGCACTEGVVRLDCTMTNRKARPAHGSNATTPYHRMHPQRCLRLLPLPRGVGPRPVVARGPRGGAAAAAGVLSAAA